MQTATLDVLDRLLAFDTTSRNSNLALIEYAKDFLARHDVESELILDGTGEKANLLAVIGPADRPGIVLSGHTDVVPVDGQSWSSDPFKARVEGGRVYGRGAADMKGYVAAALALVPRLARERLERPVILALSYDEEVGCKGVGSLVERMLARLPVPLGCVVGEPTMMRVVDGHKGKVAARCTVRGREAHSALPQLGLNAVVIASRLVGEVARMGERLAAEGPFAQGFEPPHTTASVGRIEGGSMVNIVPNHCSFEFEFRALPEEDPGAHAAEVERFAAGLLPSLRERAPEAAITFEQVLSYPGFRGDPASPFQKACMELTGTDRAGKVSYGTEAGHFAKAGVPCVVCGPGDIAVAHKPDESIALDQLAACDRFFDALVERLAVRS
ncbi:acetylornithine deacetylase [Geminicoccaceae bacterium 1502E]|nr:acetylornithine deacetylase [Geminicoccaceae bacterium 1502E]